MLGGLGRAAMLSLWRSAAWFILSHPWPRGVWIGVRTSIFHAGLFRGYINLPVIFVRLKCSLKRGEISKETTIIESSSGNMGIGLAQACRYYGLRFICVVDPRAQKQNLKIIEALGGNIDLVTEPLGGEFLTARISRVCELLEMIPNAHWINQYGNRDNPLAHCQTTIREIDDTLDGDFDVLFVATSSTGTAQGCRDYLRKRGHHADVIAVDAEGSVLFGGLPGRRLIPGLGAGKEPALAVSQVFEHVVRVSDLECVVGCRRMAAREAMLVGGSAGGVLMAVDRLKQQMAGKRCVAILHDSGTRYLDTVFDNDWVHQSLNCSGNELRQLVDTDIVAPRERVTA